MGLHVFLFSLLSSILLCGNEVIGDILKLSKEEDWELERKLKHLNKPAIKTIHREYGDIYDCVDFYKQPAFDHPLLKNHTFDFEMEEESNEPEDPEVLEFRQNFGLDGEECPLGTVMIKRLIKSDLIREKIISKLGETGHIHYAGVRTKGGRPAIYAGAACKLGIYNPHVRGEQFSAARMVLQAGLFDRIAVGWRVDPQLTRDFKTYFYIRTDVGAGGDTHCYGTSCLGFVHTAKKIPISWIFNNVSQKGRPPINFPVDILRDPKTGNWRLRVGPYDRIELGYWPKHIFSSNRGLSDLADSIEYGGEVYASPNFPKPEMGIGSFPKKVLSESSFNAALTYRNDLMKKIDAKSLETNADLEQSYKAIDLPYMDSFWRHVVFYGGPGGK